MFNPLITPTLRLLLLGHSIAGGADNITLNSGTGGSVVATDDDGVAHHQYVKVEFGADNTQTKVTSTVGLPTTDLATQVDDAAFTPATGRVIMFGAEADDTLPDSVDEGDGGAVRMSANRNLYVRIRDNAGNERGLNVDANGAIAATVTNATAANLLNVPSGNVAHDAVDSGNPIKIGAKAETSPKGITLVADADRTDLLADSDGLLMVKLNTSNADRISEAVSDTAGTSTAFTNFSAVASTFNYVTAIAIFRTDAGTTPAYVDFRDGTAGAVLWRMPLPPNGGSALSSATSLFRTSANTALAYDVSAALTTVYINVSGFQSKV